MLYPSAIRFPAFIVFRLEPSSLIPYALTDTTYLSFDFLRGSALSLLFFLLPNLYYLSILDLMSFYLSFEFLFLLLLFFKLDGLLTSFLF